MKGLTKARRDFLEMLIKEGGTGRGASYYPPIKWLHENGMIGQQIGKYSDYWEITDAGRAAVASDHRGTE